jgi:hypothetical protein
MSNDSPESPRDDVRKASTFFCTSNAVERMRRDAGVLPVLCEGGWLAEMPRDQTRAIPDVAPRSVLAAMLARLRVASGWDERALLRSLSLVCSFASVAGLRLPYRLWKPSR